MRALRSSPATPLLTLFVLVLLHREMTRYGCPSAAPINNACVLWPGRPVAPALHTMLISPSLDTIQIRQNRTSRPNQSFENLAEGVSFTPHYY